MTNLTSNAPSLDKLYSDSQTYGPWPVLLWTHTAVTTAATITSGYTSCMRCTGITVPTVTSPTTGFCFTNFNAVGSQIGVIMAALEYTLGTLTVSGNSYVGGSSMPSKSVRGVSMQTATLLPIAFVSTTLAATTPTLTMNYTDQNGSASSGTLVLPTNSTINSCFLFNANLAAGDTGVQSLSPSSPNGLSISTGTAGVIKLVGLLPIGFAPVSTTTNATGVAVDILDQAFPLFKAEPSETIAFYYFGTSTANDIVISMIGQPEQ